MAADTLQVEPVRRHVWPRRVVAMLTFMCVGIPMAAQSPSAAPTGRWEGRLNQFADVTIEVMALGDRRTVVRYMQPEARGWMTLEALTFADTVAASDVAPWTVELRPRNGGDVVLSLAWDATADVLLAERLAGAVTLSAVLRRPGDMRPYSPRLRSVAAPPAASIADLPAAERWITHARDELGPFWMRPEALGTPVGAFPTVRCADGAAFSRGRSCPEFGDGAILGDDLGKEFTRMRSRQVFAYGVLFHLTGDTLALRYAAAGVDWLRRHAMDRTNGGAFTWFDGETRGPAPDRRTSQDLAYANMGLAFYYYLTRDPAVLDEVLALKRHIFTAYDDPALGMLRFARTGDDGRPDLRQDLTAQLDQLNAYMLMLLPVLPEPHRSEWQRDATRLVKLLIARFHDDDELRFWGYLHDPSGKTIWADHADFGHTVKTYWMVERFARLSRNDSLARFAERGIAHTLALAYIASPDGAMGWWSGEVMATGRPARQSMWWISAELDQAAATLALRDTTAIRYLARTYPSWFARFVDPVHHEVWAAVGADGTPFPAKAYSWKNGFHSLEHALVAYITTRALRAEPVDLYFAFDDPAAPVAPYLYDGSVSSRVVERAGTKKGPPVVRVRFADLERGQRGHFPNK